MDGVPAEDVGGGFDFGTVSRARGWRAWSCTGTRTVALYGSDAGGCGELTTPRGTTLKPVLNYSGDAGNLHTWRNEVTAGGTLRKLDYFAGFRGSIRRMRCRRTDITTATAVANLGYDLFKGASIRATVRDTVAAQGVAGGVRVLWADDAWQAGRSGPVRKRDGGGSHRSGWHNLVRYGIARKREQASYFGSAGTR